MVDMGRGKNEILQYSFDIILHFESHKCITCIKKLNLKYNQNAEFLVGSSYWAPSDLCYHHVKIFEITDEEMKVMIGRGTCHKCSP